MHDREPDDRALVGRMRRGDEAAFEAFFARTFPALFRFALPRVGRDEDAAEEVVQAALSRAVSRLGTWRGEAALFTWLATFCRHEIAEHWRRRGSHRGVELVEDLPEVRAALESLAATDPRRPEEALRRSELARLVQATLDRLPGRYGDVLEWKYVQGLSVQEIADRLSVGPKAAESVLTRAREAFRDGWLTVEGALEEGR
jgi:RNA polymerase sigma-70 factor (ECF subfamily)